MNLTLRREYQEGDTIVFEIGGETGHYWMQVDDVLGKSLVYLTGDQTYEIPFEEKKFNLSPKAFTGENSCFAFARQDLMRSIFIAIWQKMSTISMEM